VLIFESKTQCTEVVVTGADEKAAANGGPRKLTPDQLAAHDLLSELRTRISTQRLPYQYGVESTALKSLYDIFGLARKAMKDHPGCSEFAKIATHMLNVELRPLTAKWHRALEAGILDSRDGANDFRDELDKLRPRLVAFSRTLQDMAYGKAEDDPETPDVLSQSHLNECFGPLKFGIDEVDTTGIRSRDFGTMKADETAEITRRRQAFGIVRAEDEGAVGLALSGGGIRSATFCLGVIQFLAERELIKDFDYLSTVSGGGYTGTFVSCVLGGSGTSADIAAPHGPDTAEIRHVRQNAKYLSTVDLRHRWLMVTGTVAGLILNWTIPLSFIAVLAALSVRSSEWISSENLLRMTGGFAIATAICVLVYGLLLRVGLGARLGSSVLAWIAGITVGLSAIFLIERGFEWISQLQTPHWTITGGALLAILTAPAAATFLPIFQSDAFRKLFLKVALYAAGLIAPIFAVGLFWALQSLGHHPQDPSGDSLIFRYASGRNVLEAIAAISLVYAFLGLNINLTGPHKLYRDQLAKTFVRTTGGDDWLPISEMNTSGRAPYHLVNATVNLPSSTSPVLRDRRGDFFLFSKHWIGSSAVGYHPSTAWWLNGKPVDLATAMAISGAAASPHMGLGSLPTLSGLMTLLNIRLGVWIANPKNPPHRPPGAECLFREMTGISMSEARGWLNVSDGGHIENMGLYELLRRRCKFIVCVDGEADPESTFHGQLTLVRHAQIDLGIRIEPRLDEMRPDPKTRYSKTHAQLFRIIYPPARDGRDGGMGLLLYLKLSLTGDEAELLKRYKFLHPDFPHQSTLDQFYDEEQFEAYRQLGVHVAKGTFAPALLRRTVRPQNVEDWFRQLAENMLEPMKP
jgi:hypothetical protein